GTRLIYNDSSSLSVAPVQDNVYGLGIGNVLLLKYAVGERVLIIVIEHGSGPLHDDGAVIEMLIHEMHGAARNSHAVLERLLLRLQPGKSRQQRRMNVQDALRKLLNEPRREQAHISGEANQVNVILLEHSNHFGIVLLTGLAF